MPYKKVGSKVYHLKGGKWKRKATAKSKGSAKRMINLLRGVEHGWKPMGAPAKRGRLSAMKRHLSNTRG